MVHTLDLRPPATELRARLHKDSIQRKLRRAVRERIDHVEGQSDALLRSFYRLLVLTRRRHAVPPQPFEWFEHLRECLGDRLNVRVAVKDGQPIAGILTLRHRQTLFYKYGASDAAHHSSGAMPLLFWRLIEDGHRAGLRALDLGRSDIENPGLITFKDRLGAAASTLTYLRYPAASPRRRGGYTIRLARRMVPFLPDSILKAAGRLLYRHAG